MHRRQFFTTASTLALLSAPLGCTRAQRDIEGGFSGTDLERGHAVRQRLASTHTTPTPDIVRRASIVIAGGGIAGLAAARALRLAGRDDFVLLELQDQAGGNSRSGIIKGIPCPLGAHYLPLPSNNAPEVQDFLEELGLRQRIAGRWQYDERYLCHSPQERLFWGNTWHEGLLPIEDVGPETLRQYRHFSRRVAELARSAAFQIPTLRTWHKKQSNQALAPVHQALDAILFDTWLRDEGLVDVHLRWYLDYCCRDDFGADSHHVSAWAGIHYFASRHGFHVPGDTDGPSSDERNAVLTWPEGNGWLSNRLAQPLHDSGRLRTGSSVLRIEQTRHGVQVDTYHHASDSIERWVAARCIVALPIFMAARVVHNPPSFLTQAAQRLRWAAWLVANIHIDRPLQDRPGAAPAWDNVLYADSNPGALGYVNAGHQRLALSAQLHEPTVLTYYQALGDAPEARHALQEHPWTHWRDAIMTSLSRPHPDIALRTTRIELMRYGHAMSIPVPGVQQFLSQIGLQSASTSSKRTRAVPTPRMQRLTFAHADWSGYSVFEEAFTRGHAAGLESI